MDENNRVAYFAQLGPGSSVDHRGTEFTAELLQRLLAAVREPDGGTLRLTSARFTEAVFTGPVDFTNATFRGAWFDETHFHCETRFNGAHFGDDAHFAQARWEGKEGKAADFRSTRFGADADFHKADFEAGAWFDDAEFQSGARFTRTSFGGSTRFKNARFGDNADFKKVKFVATADFGKTAFGCGARFTRASFAAHTRFVGTEFEEHAHFDKASFERTESFGPVVCGGSLNLKSAVFASPVIVSAAAQTFQCRGTRWEARAVLQLRYATVDLTNSVFEYPLSVSGHDAAFSGADESKLAGCDPRVAVSSLSGTDAAHLTLSNVDLRHCGFIGTVHLDQLRLEGNCHLALPPAKLQRKGWRPTVWTSRYTLAEEHHWRTAQGATGWQAAPAGRQAPSPATLAPVYRQLRKSFEDNKNEPDAADFYYGEMEMRRHDRGRSWAERALLHVYWAVSGYGLRALRAGTCLVAAMAITTLLLVLWGVPQDSSKAQTTGAVSGGRFTATTDTPDPVNPGGSLLERWNGERFDKAVQVTVNSVAFRSSGERLTTRGTYIEIVSRIVEPVLLALTLLAFRNRVKR
ncbi:pentapeptide repeat-containing protein [Streptomyces sp. NPDC002130]|uniref:pentapeptide repeat-containing protein n=1 Tax=Streptomyces sp. NPDC002130 TaxID=3155568 RepID=UPI003325C028